MKKNEKHSNDPRLVTSVGQFFEFFNSSYLNILKSKFKNSISIISKTLKKKIHFMKESMALQLIL
jgi:hypothetical protein